MDPALIPQGVFLQHSSLTKVNLGVTTPPTPHTGLSASGLLHMSGGAAGRDCITWVIILGWVLLTLVRHWQSSAH